MPQISGERDRIKKIIAPIISQKLSSLEINGVKCSLKIGSEGNDDCAVFDVGDVSIVIGSDFVRGTGFRLFDLGILNYYDVGRYLIVANISDVAAMGARPFALTTIVRYKENMTDEDFENVFRGMSDAAAEYGSVIIGGDIGNYSENVFAATALGITEKGRYMLRNGAKPGDLLCVTGPIGIPAAARLYFEEAQKRGFRLDKKEEEILANSWKKPTARVKEGLILAKNGLGHSCQDISDGLKETIIQTCQLSECSFTITEDKLPIPDVVKKVAGFFKINPTFLAMGPSVDFELMFTIDKKGLGKCSELFKQSGCSLFVIGEATKLSENKMLFSDGKTGELPGFVMDHRKNLDSVIDSFT